MMIILLPFQSVFFFMVIMVISQMVFMVIDKNHNTGGFVYMDAEHGSSVNMSSLKNEIFL